MNRRTALTAMVVTASGLAVASPLRGADAATPVNPGGTAMDVNQAVVNYISIWNERDATRRRALIAQTLSEDCSYVGPQREGAGQDAIDAMIATAQQQSVLPLPSGQSPAWRMSLASGIDTHHNYVRFSWTVGGTAEAPLYTKQTVFAILAADGRFKSVIGFTDAAPARLSK